MKGINLSNVLFFGILVFIGLTKIQAQPCSPGSVPANLKLWVKADAGTSTTVSGAAINSWSDQSGLGNNLLQPTTAKQPTYVPVFHNFNPSINFDGVDDNIKISTSILGGANSELTTFFVLTEDVRKENITISFQSTTTGNRYFTHYPWSDGNIYWDAGTALAPERVSGAAPFAVGQPSIGTLTNSLSNNKQSINVNGALLYTDNTGHSLFAGQANIGGESDGGVDDYYDGKAGEWIVYNRYLTPLEQLKVQSYLAIKYGITLNPVVVNYLCSTGSIRWNNLVYWNDVAGIAKDNASCLLQKQSKSVNANSVVTVSLGSIAVSNQLNTGSFTNDKDYLIWGSNNGPRTFAATGGPVGYAKLYNRVWKVAEWDGSTGGNGNVISNLTVGFSKTEGNLTLPDASYALIIDTNGNGVFTDETPIPGGITDASGRLVFNGINFDHNQLFSLVIKTTEICENLIDDDGDGLIDEPNILGALTSGCSGVILPGISVDENGGVWTLQSSAGTTFNALTGEITLGMNSGTLPDIDTLFYLLPIAQGGCADTLLATIFPTPIAIAGADVSICQGATAVLGTSSVVGNTYSWTPSTGLSSTTVSNPTANSSVTTTYSLTVANVAGCMSTDNVLVTVETNPTAFAGSDNSICSGNSVTIGVPSVPGNVYNWVPATGLSNSAISNPTATPLVTTTYTLTVTNAAGCTATDNVLITVNANPIAFAGPDQSICFGSTTTIGGPSVAGNTYNWTPVTGLSNTAVSNPTANPSVTTTYTLTVTNAAGCTATDIIVVTAEANPIAFTGPDKSICLGSSTTIGGAGAAGYTYNWTPATGLSNPSISNPTASPLVTTTYTLTVTSATGCVGTNTVTIMISATSTSATTFIICEGNTLALGNAPVAGSTYNWSPAATLSNSSISNPLASPLTTTVYLLTSTSATGCISTDTFTVDVHLLPTVSAGADAAICDGLNVSIGSAPSAGITYSWAPAVNLSNSSIADPIASPLATTTYTVTATDAFGCSSTDNVSIMVNPNPIAFAGPDINICSGGNVLLGDVSVAGDTYGWTPSAGLSNVGISNPTSIPAATTIYILNVTNVFGCIDADTVVISVNLLPTVSAGADVAICPGSNSLIGGPATAGINYSWTPNISLSNSLLSNPVAQPLVSTVYVLTVTDAFGCFDTDSVNVTVNPVPTAIAGPDDSICHGSGINIGSSTVVGNTYLWSPSVGLSNTAISNPWANPSTTTTYVLTVSNAFGCTNTDDVTLTVSTSSMTISAIGSFCDYDNTVSLNGTPVGGTWYGNGVTNLPTAGFSPSVAGAGIHPVTYVISGTCPDSLTQFVVVHPKPEAFIFADTNQGCVNQSSVINFIDSTTSPGGSFNWNFGDNSNALIHNPSHLYGSAGVFDVYLIYTSADGCSDSVFVNNMITIHSLPVASFTTSSFEITNTDPPVHFINTTAGMNNSFLWSFENGDTTTVENPAYNFVNAGSFPVMLQVTNEYGCMDAVVHMIQVNAETGLYIPNSFSPNDDGINDFFGPKGYGIRPDTYSMKIFNRWGEMIFSTTDLSETWNGRRGNSGEIVQQDVYVYKIFFIGISGEIRSLIGHVTIIK